MCKTNFPNRDLLAKQTELQDQMQANGLNLVECPNCGGWLIHTTDNQDIVCPYCGHESEPSDFSDCFYKGFEQSAEFNAD